MQNGNSIKRFYLFGYPVFQYTVKNGKKRFSRVKKRKARQDQRVFYLKVNRPHHTSYQCIQQWHDIASACNAFCYFVCDDKKMEYEIFKNVEFNNLDFCFIPSDRKILKNTVEKAINGRDYKKWRLIAHSMLTPFLHAAKNNFTRSYNIDADDIRILLAPDVVKKALEKAEEYADNKELDCFNLDMFVSRTFGVLWSFGVAYVRTPTKCLEVLKKNVNWKENNGLLTKYKTEYVLDDYLNINIDAVFAFLKDTEQLKAESFYIENSRVVHMPDRLLDYWGPFLLHWKSGHVFLPLFHEFYNDKIWGTVPIADGLVKIDLHLTDEDFWHHMAATHNYSVSGGYHLWSSCLEQAKHREIIDDDTYRKYRGLAGESHFFRENNIENPSYKYPNKKISFLGLPIYSRKYQAEKQGQYSTLRYRILGGLVQLKKRTNSCRLSILGATVMTLTRMRAKFFGITIRRNNFRQKWLGEIQSHIDKKYDDIYFLRHNIGESYVELMHLSETLKVNGSKRPLLVLWDKKHAGFYKMFLPQGMEMQFISLNQDDIHAIFSEETSIVRNNQRFICGTPLIAENMKKLMVKDPDINFYDHINKAGGIEKGAVPAQPQPSTQAIQEVTSLINCIGLSNKFVILCPETNSLVELSGDFWEAVIKGLRKKGYDIFLNIHDYSPLLQNKDIKTAKTTIEEMFVLARQSEGIISLGSGLAVFLTAAGVKMDLLYTDFRNKCIGYPPELAIRMYSVHHLPGVSQELVKEYDTSKLNEQTLIETLLKRY